MRKQTDFVVKVWPLGNGAGGESVTSEQLSEIVRNEYLSKGYEVFSTDSLQVSAGVIFYNVTFVKYEEILGTPTYSGNKQEDAKSK